MNCENGRYDFFASGYSSGFKNGFKKGFRNGLFMGDETGKKYRKKFFRQDPYLEGGPISIEMDRKETIDVIISACNEAQTIAKVIRQVRRIVQINNIIVVVNGSTDGTGELARQTGVRVIEYKDPLGYDVGRAIGAQYANADGLLFLDGDIVINAVDLVPFVEAIFAGVDVALNDISPLLTPTELTHSVVIGKYFINLAANRPDLGPNTMTAIPHALSCKALNIIKPLNLVVPPKAHLIAIQANLVVRAVKFVDVLSTNRIRPNIHLGPGVDKVEKLILGDHLEALNYLLRTVKSMKKSDEKEV